MAGDEDLIPFLQDQNQRLTKQIDFSPVLKEIERIGKAVNGDMGTLEEASIRASDSRAILSEPGKSNLS